MKSAAAVPAADEAAPARPAVDAASSTRKPPSVLSFVRDSFRFRFYVVRRVVSRRRDEMEAEEEREEEAECKEEEEKQRREKIKLTH